MICSGVTMTAGLLACKRLCGCSGSGAAADSMLPRRNGSTSPTLVQPTERTDETVGRGEQEEAATGRGDTRGNDCVFLSTTPAFGSEAGNLPTASLTPQRAVRSVIASAVFSLSGLTNGERQGAEAEEEGRGTGERDATRGRGEARVIFFVASGVGAAEWVPASPLPLLWTVDS